MGASLKSFIVLGIAQCLLLSSGAAAQCDSNDYGGTVYRDYDADASQDSQEPGVSGITVTAYNSAGTVVGTATSSATGAWSISDLAGTAVRLELSGLPSYLTHGAASTSGKSSVAFASAASCSINFGVANPAQYCESDPEMATTLYARGDPLGSGTSADLDSVVKFNFSQSGAASLSTGTAPTVLALAEDIGSTWGMAYQRSTQTVFMAASLRRFAGFGPLGTGGIYSMNVGATTPTVTQFLNLSAVGISTGADPRTTSGDPGLSPNYIDADRVDPNVDPKIGKVSLGDIDISDDEKTLWVVNLFNKTLYEIVIGNPAVTPAVSAITAHLIPDPGCSNAEYAPWATKYYDGKVYVGVVCTAETSRLAADLKAFVLKHDPTGTDGVFTTEFQMPLNYAKGFAANPITGLLTPTTLNVPVSEEGGAVWYPWIRNGLDIISSNYITERTRTGAVYPQPILADIEFSPQGEMILGFLDRFSVQTGRIDAHVAPLYDTNTMLSLTGLPDWYVQGVSGGDVLCVSRSSGSWVAESNGACGSRTSAGASNAEGPGGGEFFFEEKFVTGGGDLHRETAAGGLATVNSSRLLPITGYDPFEAYSSGIYFMDTETGVASRKYEVVSQSSPGSAGKSNGLGDLEALCDPAPIQIGNVLWIDSDADGVYDPGESAVSGATVSLYTSNGTLVSETTTNSAGEYLFTGLSVQSSYTVKLCKASDFQAGGPLDGYGLTTADVGSKNTIDSDAALVSGCPAISLTTGVAGENDHSFDFGFVSVTCTSQDTTETNVKMDSSAKHLARLVSDSLTLRNRTLARRGVCEKLSSARTAAISESAESTAQAAWGASWFLGTTHVSCSGTTVPAGCTSTSTTTYSSSQRARYSRLGRLVSSALSGCSGREVSARLTRMRRLRARGNAAAADVPNPYVTGLCVG